MVLLLAAAGAVLLLGYLLLESTSGPRAAADGPSRPGPTAEPAGGGAAPADPEVWDPGSRSAAAEASAGDPAAPSSGRELAADGGPGPRLARAERGGRAERYRGRGRIRGSLVVRGGQSPPESWRLVLSPSLFLAGRQYAVRRVVEVEPGTEEFAAEDLPLGAYDLRVEADGWNSIVQPVDLHTENRDAYVTLALTPAGFLEGQVVEVGGEPLPELPVTLAPLTGAAGRSDVEPRTVRTDALGGYRFDTVVDGAYELRYGNGQPPVLPVRRVTFEAPSMRVPTLTAPPRPALELTVVDAAGFTVPDALVVIDGPSSQVRGTTGLDGRLRISLLAAGENQVAAKHTDHGSGVLSLELPESGLVTARLELGQ